MRALEIFKSPAIPKHILDKASNVPDEAAKKIDHIFNTINLINREAKEIKSQEADLAAKRKMLELLVNQAEDLIKEEMFAEGLCEINGEMIKYTLSASPHRLIIDDESLIPKEYKREIVITEIRKDAIKDELKIGAIIPGAHLEQNKTLKCSTNKE